MIFFEKNKLDLELGTKVSITVTDLVASSTGEDFADFLRNRNNYSGWGTTDSTDAALTQVDVSFGDEEEIDTLFKIQQNFKAYTCQYGIGAAPLADFSTPINLAANTEADRYHTFNRVAVDRLRLIIAGTFTPNDDKFCTQLIATRRIGSFQTIQPEISDVEVGRDRRLVKLIGGKSRVQKSAGSIGFRLGKNNVVDPDDLALVETLHEFDSVLCWPNGDADTLQPTYAARLNSRVFWRRRDLYVVSPSTELSPGWDKGRYANGANVDINFVEVV